MEIAGAPVCRVLSATEFNALRDELRDLKQEYSAPGTRQQLEPALVRAAKESAAAREAQLKEELGKAQQALMDQLESAARARRLHEREKRRLQAHADGLAAQIEGLRQQHAAELQEVKWMGDEREQKAEEQLKQQQAALESLQASLEAKAAEYAAQLEEQYRAALADQMSRTIQQQLEQTTAQSALLARCAQLERQVSAGSAQLQQARKESAELQQRLSCMALAESEAVAAAQQAAERVAHLEEQVVKCRATAAERVGQLKQCKAAELEQLQQRFLGLLATKDATIAALRQQLVDAAEQLRQADVLLGA